MIEVNGRRYSYHHQTFSVPPLPLLPWLKAQTLFPKVYWSGKDLLEERIALGCLMPLTSIPKLSPDSHPEARFYGGQNFMGGARFWLPQIELVQKEGTTLLHLHHLEELFPSSFDFDWDLLPPPSEPHTPSKPKWEKMVQKALEACAAKTLKKVVLARRSHSTLATPIDPYALLESRKALSHPATLFLFQGNPRNTFIGASPETLYTRRGNQVLIDALAGTAPRGPTPDLDEHYRSLLWNSPKEQTEFAIVKTFIHKALKPLSTTISWVPQDQFLLLRHVQHLHNPCRATLKENVSDSQLLKALHPTPALGGFPRKKALAFIAEHEPFDRGWYGAPVGYLSSKETDMAVAIRSALIRDNEIYRMAGTGIVAGSLPESEWEELNLKIKAWEVE